MGILVFLLLIVCFVVGCFLLASATIWNDNGIVGFLMVALPILCFVLPYWVHNSNLATVENSEKIIQINTDYRERMQQQLKDFEVKGVSLLNADTPVKSIVSEIATAERNIMEAEQEILNAEISIERRKRGMSSYILWFF